MQPFKKKTQLYSTINGAHNLYNVHLILTFIVGSFAGKERHCGERWAAEERRPPGKRRAPEPGQPHGGAKEESKELQSGEPPQACHR